MDSQKNPAGASMTGIAGTQKDVDSARCTLLSILRSSKDGVDWPVKAGVALIRWPQKIKFAIMTTAAMMQDHPLAILEQLSHHKLDPSLSATWQEIARELGLPDSRLALYRLIYYAWLFENAHEETSEGVAAPQEGVEAASA